MAVVTVSATFGAGGAVISPMVARRLEVPFVDRAIPATVAAEIGCSLEDALAHDGRAEHGIGRILASAAHLPNVTLGGMDVHLADRQYVTEADFVGHTERIIREVADRGGAVILGRAAAVVLANRAGALHVRLDGPRERRIAQAIRMGAAGEEPDGDAERGTGGDATRALLDDNDRARAAYVKHFYRVDPADPGPYHLVIDSTSLPPHVCADLVVHAALNRDISD